MGVLMLRVERSSHEYEANSRGLVRLDARGLQKTGFNVGDLVRIATFQGRSILGRVAEPVAGDTGLGVIRLDKFQRQALKVKLHEEVEIFPHEAKPVSRIRMQPFVDLSAAESHHIAHHLHEELVEHHSPVAPGMLLFLHFHHSVAGTIYKIVDVDDAPGVVTAETLVILESANDGFDPDRDTTVSFSDVGGLSSEIKLIRELVQMPLQFPSIYRQMGVQPPRGVIFYGPPGTGKTHTARAVSQEVNAEFYYINGPEIIGTMYGETEGNLRRIFGEATHHAPAIILIDEIDAIAPHRGSTGAHSDTRLVTTLLTLMDGLKAVEGVMLVGTTNRIDSLDTALRRPGRFDREIYFGPPGEHGRHEILEIHSREMPLEKDARAYLPELAHQTHGFVGADLLELCREAALNAIRRSPVGLAGHLDVMRMPKGEVTVGLADFERARRTVRPSAMRESLVEIPNVRWEDVRGLAEQKEILRQHVLLPLQKPELYREHGLTDHTGVVVYGPPGTGKTMLIRALAHEAGVNFVAIDGPEIFSKWLGESEESIRHIFRVARQLAPSLLFFDQLDAIAPARVSDGGVWTTRRVVNQLLAELDGIRETDDQVTVVAATNRIDFVDPSVLRPGRLGIHIEIPLPNADTRLEILKSFMQDEPQCESLLGWMVPETEGLSGAELRFLAQEVRRANILRSGSVTHVNEADYRAVLGRLRPA